MRRIGIFYATRQGHTRRIAQHLATKFEERGLAVDLWSVVNVPPSFTLAPYEAVVLAASVHAGRHEPEMVDFVRRRKTEISQRVNAFVSVTLTQARAQSADGTLGERERAAEAVTDMTERFLRETGWTPQLVLPVAGALRYSEYGWWMKRLMKWIAARSGGATDTTHDHVYTDWAALNSLAAKIALQLEGFEARDLLVHG